MRQNTKNDFISPQYSHTHLSFSTLSIPRPTIPPTQPSVTYSSNRKDYEHNRILPYNAFNNSIYGIPTAEFSLPNMPQTNVMDAVRNDTSGVLKSFKAIGMVLDQDNKPIGSCILLPYGRILMTRHILEGRGNVQAFKAIFGYYNGSDAIIPYGIQTVIESDSELDYAIVKLSSIPKNIKPMEFGESPYDNRSALLHCPLGKPLQISVGTSDTPAYHSSRFITYHDSDFGSSGGAYIDHNGKCYAIHLGCESQDGFQSLNLERYALAISAIQEKRPQSLLFAPNATPISSLVISLPYIPRSYEEEKNHNSQKRVELAKNHQDIQRAIGRTNTRLDKHDASQYQPYTTRALAEHFPELGPSVFASQNIRHTSTNKIEFSNPLTGWHICYDKHGQYNTVFNDKNHHVALDRTTHPAGTDAKFHFSNRNASDRQGRGRS